MRRKLTPPEYLLWERLKGRDGSGLNFRRQHPIGVYILDFYSAKAKLAVEVDGAEHTSDERILHDEIREARLWGRGIAIYRIPAVAVFQNPDEAANGVILVAEERVRAKRETPPPRR
jgi:very-short-patch-repair endonuclease